MEIYIIKMEMKQHIRQINKNKENIRRINTT